ncbi:MAG: sulfatase-like hydrolase/transferase [Aureliella sp.]
MLLSALLTTTLLGSAVDARQPNVILILADDLGYETVGCYGGQSYATPNLDRLAATGVRFDRAYAMPLCTNTRIQLMTGKLNLRNWSAFGILPPGEPTFGQLMRKAGYRTCIAGKWQLTSYDPPDYPGAALRRDTGVHPRDSGFDEYCLWHVGHTESKGSRYADPVIEQNGVELDDTTGKYGPDLYSGFINEFMEKNAGDPFFVYYSMALPHNPMVPTPDSPEWADPELRHSDETHFTKDMIEYTDKVIGKIVEKLEALNLRDDTLLLFYSDNGTNNRVASQFRGKYVRGGKGKGIELGIRVPAIANWPGKIQPGQVRQDLVDSVDFLPTMLEAANANVPGDLDGVSFLDVITEGTGGRRDWAYIHQDPRPGWDKDRFRLILLVVGRRYKLYEDGRLFDVVDDLYETQPIFIGNDTPEQREARVRLQTVLDEMEPYRGFDPKTVPRPNPNDVYERYQFQDQGGYLIVEAEQLPVRRDESWNVETGLLGYTGSAYLRAIRGHSESAAIRELSQGERLGEVPIYLSIDVAGRWECAVRCRSDHPDQGRARRLWIRQEPWSGKTAETAETVIEGSEALAVKWQSVEIPPEVASGQWHWVTERVIMKSQVPALEPLSFDLKERGNRIWLLPGSQNLKIDRIVFYQPDQKERAFDLRTPRAEYHPWASP